MKNPGSFHFLPVQLFSSEHHVCSRAAVEGKISVAVWKLRHKGKGGRHILIQKHSFHIDSLLCSRLLQPEAEGILTDFSNECSSFPQLLKHGQNVARSSSRIGFEQSISLFRDAVLRKINQQLSQSCHVIFLHICSSSRQRYWFRVLVYL